MRKILLLIPLFSISLLCNAQYKWDVGGKLGCSNYLGDIGGGTGTRRNFVPDMKMPETRFAGGLFVRYRVHPKVSVQGGFDYVHIEGKDALTPNLNRKYRNLTFYNNIFEVNVLAQYYFYEINDLGHTYRYRNDFKAYLGLGAAGFYHDPHALDGTDLYPLHTELNTYSHFGFAIPYQIGFYFTVNKRYRIGWDLTMRQTFTDYLDDVSGNYPTSKEYIKSGGTQYNYDHYVDPTTQLNISQAWKNNYGDPHSHSEAPNKRGQSNHTDSYLSSTINFSYALRGKSTFYKSTYGSIFKGKKYKKRKFRAKF